jgi:hypothetical protein
LDRFIPGNSYGRHEEAANPQQRPNPSLNAGFSKTQFFFLWLLAFAFGFDLRKLLKVCLCFRISFLFFFFFFFFFFLVLAGRMSFWGRMLGMLAGKFEQHATKTLQESQTFKRVVHTVEKEGLTGVKRSVQSSRAGLFTSLFVDELKQDLGLKKTPKQQQKLLQKRQ